MRRSALLGVMAVVPLLLAGCSIFDPGPPRDDSGAISEAKIVPGSTLLVGDCFSFLEDGSLDRVSAVPCADDHAYVVVGQGDLSATDVSTAGSLQNAVSAACADDFETYRASLTDGSKPEQQFLVTEVERDGTTVTAFSCVASDGAQPAVG